MGMPTPCICMETLSKVGCDVTRCLSKEMRNVKTHTLPLLLASTSPAEAS